jgi:hypothetical protein
VQTTQRWGNEIAAKALLESEGNVESKMMLFEKYKSEGDVVNAARVLNEILSIYNPDYAFGSFIEEERYNNNRNYFVEIASIENNLRIENREFSELNQSEIQTLETISNEDLPISAKAKVLLAYNGHVLQQRPIKKLSDFEMNEILYGNTNEFNYNLSLTPNPASDLVNVCFSLPAGATSIKLKLIDEYNHVGLLLETRSVGQTEICKQLTISNYLNGVYRIVLEHDGVIATGSHLIIEQ